MIKDKIKSLRESRNLSRKEFAKILDCSISQVINLETGAARLSENFKEVMEEYFDLPENFFGSLESSPPIQTSEYDKVIGKNVCFYRKQNGMTQQILAEEMGYSQASSVSAIERGQKPIGKKKLIKLAGIFEIHVAELFNVSDAANSTEDEVLYSKFIYLLHSAKKPSVYNAIKELIDSGCKELRHQKIKHKDQG